MSTRHAVRPPQPTGWTDAEPGDSGNTARWAGILILVSTTAYLVGSGLVDASWDGARDLVALRSHETQVTVGVLLQMVNAAAVVSAGVLLHRLLRRHDETAALGYAAGRIIEGALVAVSAITPLLLMTLSKQVDAGVAPGADLQATAAVLTRWYELAFQAGMLSLGIGSLLLCRALYRSRLVPPFLAILGFLGYLCLIVSVAFEFSGQRPTGALYAPGAIFEVAFPLWLIVRGLGRRAPGVS